MSSKRLNRLLRQLEECRYRFGHGAVSRTVTLLNSIAASQFPDPQSLMRFHEALLFLRAFAQGPGVLRMIEKLLNSFSQRVASLRKNGIDLSAWDTFEFAGV